MGGGYVTGDDGPHYKRTTIGKYTKIRNYRFSLRFATEHVLPGNNQPTTMRQKFNPIIKKLVVNIPPENNFNRKFVAGLAIVIAALDGRKAN